MPKNRTIPILEWPLSGGGLYNFWHSLPALKHAIWCWPAILAMTLPLCFAIVPGWFILAQNGQITTLPYLLLFIPILGFHIAIFLVMRSHRPTLSVGVGTACLLIWVCPDYVNDVSALRLWLAEYVTLCNVIAYLIVWKLYRSHIPNRPAAFIRLYGQCFVLAGGISIVLVSFALTGISWKDVPIPLESVSDYTNLATGSHLMDGIMHGRISPEAIALDGLTLVVLAGCALLLLYIGQQICQHAGQVSSQMPDDMTAQI